MVSRARRRSVPTDPSMRSLAKYVQALGGQQAAAEREDPRHERHGHDARPGIVERHRTGEERPASTASTSRRRPQRHARPTARWHGPLAAAVAVVAAGAEAAERSEARDLAGFQMHRACASADFALPLALKAALLDCSWSTRPTTRSTAGRSSSSPAIPTRTSPSS